MAPLLAEPPARAVALPVRDTYTRVPDTVAKDAHSAAPSEPMLTRAETIPATWFARSQLRKQNTPARAATTTLKITTTNRC